jgi:RimJ/RimL family protein N-acetyltransferase
MNQIVLLEPLEGIFVDQLVDILNNDHKLAETLSTTKKNNTHDQFVEENTLWANKHKANMFAMVLNGMAIGMVSLSHINLRDKSAQIGYWLSSIHWNKGFASSAFLQVLALAKDMEINQVSCKINKDNMASKAIWVKNNATISEENGKLIARLYL